MPPQLIAALAIGVIFLTATFFELLAGKAYGKKLMFFSEASFTRWHYRKEDPLSYWAIIATHAIPGLCLIIFVAYKTLA